MRSILFSALASTALLGGCSTVGADLDMARGVESVHQPVVSRSDYAFDVTAGPAGLAPGEGPRLAGWMNSLRLGYGDRIAIDDPSGGHAAVRSQVGGMVAGHGLIMSDEAPITGAPIAPGTVRVVVTRAVASVRGCPDWHRDGSHEFEGAQTSNFGCAINTNLAAMIANPEDLVRGQAGLGVADVATATKPIDAYRKSTPTGGGGSTLKSESSKAGGN